MSIISLIAAFGGGVWGASIGALPAFIMTGVVATIGGIVACADPTGALNELLVGNIAFGSFFGPHVSFLGGVAASAYAAKVGKSEAGADIATALQGLGAPDVLVVGGVFGVIGFIIASVIGMAFGATGGAIGTDNPGFAVFWGGVIVRLVFGKRGLLSAPTSRKTLSTGGALSNTLLIAFAYALVVSCVYVGMAEAGFAAQLGNYHVVIFGLAATGLIFAEFGQAYFGWHHIGIIAAEAVMAAYGAGMGIGAIAVGVIFGLIAGVLADFEGNYLNTDVDSHIDPPAFAIWILTIVITVIW